MIETPCGPLIGHNGSIPGFSNYILSTEGGRRQTGVVTNLNAATPAVDDAYTGVVIQLATQLLEGAPCDPASARVPLRATLR